MNRSESKMGNQNARKYPRELLRSRENMDGFEEGKKFIVRVVSEWAKEQEIYVYRPLLEKFLKKI